MSRIRALSCPAGALSASFSPGSPGKDRSLSISPERRSELRTAAEDVTPKRASEIRDRLERLSVNARGAALDFARGQPGEFAPEHLAELHEGGLIERGDGLPQHPGGNGLALLHRMGLMRMQPDVAAVVVACCPGGPLQIRPAAEVRAAFGEPDPRGEATSDERSPGAVAIPPRRRSWEG